VKDDIEKQLETIVKKVLEKEDGEVAEDA